MNEKFRIALKFGAKAYPKSVFHKTVCSLNCGGFPGGDKWRIKAPSDMAPSKLLYELKSQICEPEPVLFCFRSKMA